jgi:hypothetical protein
MGRRLFYWALVAVLLGVPTRGSAHLDLVSPVSRYGPDVLKTGPCGVDGGERSDNISVFEPGETIEIQWVEYVQHPGHYRIAFDDDGHDDFVDPRTMTEMYSNEAVLLDGIEDTRESGYGVEITLPDVTCDNCTLQVIQVMYDKPPYTTPGNDIYYQCADLVLREADAPDPPEPLDPPEPPAPMEPMVDPMESEVPLDGTDPLDTAQMDAGSGCETAPSSTAHVWWIACLVVWGVRRLAQLQDLPL